MVCHYDESVSICNKNSRHLLFVKQSVLAFAEEMAIINEHSFNKSNIMCGVK